MLPSRIFFDNFLDDMEHEIEPKKLSKMMKCDIYEEDGMYHVVADVPGFKKEDIHVEYENGYLKIVATHNEDERNHKKYMRRERFTTSRCERSFYLGEGLKEDEIKAEFKNGILKVSIPMIEKEEPKKKIINID
jgi:hypothetical protein